jgi:perosamine synthetase
MRHPLANDPSIAASVRAVLEDGTWCDYSGWALETLTQKLSGTFQQPYVQLCSSGTIATEIALHGLQIERCDEVILSGYDFPGNFRSIEAVGARPVLIDVEADNWLIDCDQIEAAISPYTKAIIVSHLHGQNNAMHRIQELAQRHGLKVIEDACQAQGARLDGHPIGSFGDCATLSFGGSKLLTSGRGGAVLCSDPLVAQRIKSHCERGNNAYPLSQLQAAALIPQLDSLSELTDVRFAAVRDIELMFSDAKLQIQLEQRSPLWIPAYYKWPMLLGDRRDDLESTANYRDHVLACFDRAGVFAGVGFHGFHRRIGKRCRAVNDLINVRKIVASTILISHHSIIQPNIAVRLIDALKTAEMEWHENTVDQ